MYNICVVHLIDGKQNDVFNVRSIVFTMATLKALIRIRKEQRKQKAIHDLKDFISIRSVLDGEGNVVHKGQMHTYLSRDTENRQHEFIIAGWY